MVSPIDTLTKIRTTELDEFFEDNPHKPWDTNEWKQNREVGDECQWCQGTDGPFHPHHLSDTPNWSALWMNATDQAFASSKLFRPSLASARQQCPSCGYKSYYSRDMSPTYRCRTCKETFDKPETVTETDVVASADHKTSDYVGSRYYSVKAIWLQRNRKTAVDAFTELFDQEMAQYLRFEDVITLCASCHYQEEQTSNVRCDRCGSFHRPNKDMCWDCLVDEKGLVHCSQCDDGWYQESKYDACSDCR